MSVFLGLVSIVYMGSTLFEAFKYISFFFVVILMKIIFDTKYYRHTKVGLALCGLGLVLLAVVSMTFDSDSYWQCNAV